MNPITEQRWITKGSEIKQMIKEGWELWYLPFGGGSKLPGSWHMQYQGMKKDVHWDAIERARQNLQWFRDHTNEIQVGQSWVYRLKQRTLGI